VVENLPVPLDRRVWQEACALRDEGWQVSVICPTGAGYDVLHEVISDIRVYRYPLPPESRGTLRYFREYGRALAAEYRLLRRIAREQGFHVVHLCNPPDILFLGALPYRLFKGTRVIFDHHDRSPELYVAKYGHRGFFYVALLLVERLTFAVADVVITPNETHRDVAISRGRKKPEDVFVVRSDLPARDAPSDAADDADSRPQHHRIGYIGVLGEQDGVDILLRAAHYVRQERGRRDVEFVIIGGGPAYDDLVELSSDLGIEDAVTFTGFLNREAATDVLRGCTVCVSPDPKNEYTDGCTMNKVLEYMALGKPQVQFDLVEGRRSAEGASLYARDNDPRELGDAIMRLMDGDDLRRTLSAEALRRSQLLSWEAQIPHLVAAYARVAEGRQ
jgi:glycosyltransferase involved in cell wall biosynthesis